MACDHSLFLFFLTISINIIFYLFLIFFSLFVLICFPGEAVVLSEYLQLLWVILANYWNHNTVFQIPFKTPRDSKKENL